MEAVVADGHGNLCVGGEFAYVGDLTVNYVAKWNGSSWSALGSGMNDAVGVLIMLGSDLYAGGVFQSAGCKASEYIAHWHPAAVTGAGSWTWYY